MRPSHAGFIFREVKPIFRSNRFMQCPFWRLGAPGKIIQRIFQRTGSASNETAFPADAGGFRASRKMRCSTDTFAARIITSQIHATIIGGRSMTYTIHAWKADQNLMTVRIGPVVAVDKARELEKMGWRLRHQRHWQPISAGEF